MTENRAWAGFWLTTVLMGVAAAMWASGEDPWSRLESEPLVSLAAVSLGFAGAGASVWRSQSLIGTLLVVSGLTTALSLVGMEYGRIALLESDAELPLSRAAAMVGWTLWAPGFGFVVGVLPQLFPDGRLLSRRWRVGVVLAVVGAAMGVVGSLLASATADRSDLFSGETPSGIAGDFAVVTDIGRTVMLTAGAMGIASLVVRYRRASGSVRRQLLWLLVGFAVMVALLTAALLVESGWVLFEAAGVVALPASIVVAIRRHRLWDVERVVSRTAIYLAMSGLVGLGYLVVVVAGATVFEERSTTGVAVIAAVGIAVAFQPARDLIQARVERFVYGSRRDAAATMAALREGVRVQGSRAEVLGSVAASVREELRLGYVAIRVGEAAEPLAASGDPRPGVEIPLQVDGQRVGSFLVAPAPGDRISESDQRVLDSIATQISLLVLTTGLVEELRASREQIIVAREDERRRLRRDLHDGLGPALAGLALHASVAADAAPSDVSRAVELLHRISTDANEITKDVRRLVQGLRPPALDELGLAKAVEQLAESPSGRHGTPEISVATEGDLNKLSAAVEVAAYRIATEAVTNVRKHAHASECHVRFTAGEWLEVEVRDNGRGIGSDDRTGVGMLSMRERITELSGTLTVESGAHGTRVLARLPIT